MNLEFDGKTLNITNPEKLLWPALGIRKLDYLKILLELAPYLLPHVKDHLLTTIRYPDGFQGKSFFQKNIPDYAPGWIPTIEWRDNQYILLESEAILIWLGNQACLEFHIPFNPYDRDQYPSALVFDLDPSEDQTFEDVTEAALLIFEELQALQITSYIKTSGASGLQIHIPTGGKYDYGTARKINEFFAVYFSQKYPRQITLERSVAKRGHKLYFDYLQMWQGKTIISPYSPRATASASVAAPLEWEELRRGVKPQDFNLLNISSRLKDKGDLFAPLLNKKNGQDRKNSQDLDFILERIVAYRQP
ncbi:MAG: DNA polymerase domain-containing protein [Dehalobacter sp. 4CP]|uniref:non-homologous end-joining DNA ligase n=1 Tax=Dehalobacter sp. CP TaxID=2594474 RepID=UPI0013C6C2D4|nr:non-homologous end-joining DNA ligase [Dehalobacter sp.]NBJ15626.1 DNA polymerase domain-containing protein [Dehalobacter sp. 4CP]